MRKEERQSVHTYKYGKKTSRLGNSLLFVVLLTMAALTGCGKTQVVTETDAGTGNGAEISGNPAEIGDPAINASEASADDQAGISFGDKVLTETEAVIYEKIQRAAGQEIVLFDCADFDGDGQTEGYALAGIREDGSVSGQIWFAKENGDAENVIPACFTDGVSERNADVTAQTEREVCLLDSSQIYEMPDGKKFWQVETFGGSVTASLLWSVADGTAQESIVSGKGAQFEKTQAGDYLLYKANLDACTDGKVELIAEYSSANDVVVGVKFLR